MRRSSVRGAAEDQEERLLFLPDPCVPYQYDRQFRGRGCMEPEKRLMLALLEDAFNCLERWAGAKDRRGQALRLKTASSENRRKARISSGTCPAEPDFKAPIKEARDATRR